MFSTCRKLKLYFSVTVSMADLPQSLLRKNESLSITKITKDANLNPQKWKRTKAFFTSSSEFCNIRLSDVAHWRFLCVIMTSKVPKFFAILNLVVMWKYQYHEDYSDFLVLNQLFLTISCVRNIERKILVPVLPFCFALKNLVQYLE